MRRSPDQSTVRVNVVEAVRLEFAESVPFTVTV